MVDNTSWVTHRWNSLASDSIVRRGRTGGSGSQRWYCKDCRRTFTANVGRVLGMSKLPVETWVTYVEAFIDQLSLRDCMDKCGVGLRTAWFMRRRRRPR